jgi:hypothetical protein
VEAGMEEIPTCKCGCGTPLKRAKKDNGVTRKGEYPRYIKGHFAKIRYGILQDRFWSKVNVRDIDSCWEWMASKNPKGYGIFRYKGRMHGAHRIAFLLSGGILSEEKSFACHRCNFPSCVNPAHLYAGDAQDNANDMVGCGRESHQSINNGANNGMSILSDDDVCAMRNMFKRGDITKVEVAKMFNVSDACVSRIINRKGWRHLP